MLNNMIIFSYMRLISENYIFIYLYIYSMYIKLVLFKNNKHLSEKIKLL